MRKAIKKFGLLIAMLFASIEAYSYDFTVDGIYYSVISLPDMTCKVVQGDEKYKGDIVIPSEVTFNNRKLSVKEIEGDNINFGTYIELSAFANCDALTSVSIPPSVTKIGKGAFYGCKSLASVTIPNSVEEIGGNAFYECESLTFITIPTLVTKIEYETFKRCKSLTSITIPNSVMMIGDDAFYGCESLTSITIPNSVTEIGDAAFSNCESLTSITIPNSVTSIGTFLFWDCTSLANITLSDSTTFIPEGVFCGCENLSKLVLPGAIQFISQYWYYTHIYNETFANCNSLKNLSILNSTESLSVGYLNDYTYMSSGWDSWTKTIENLFIDRPLETAIPVLNLEKLELGESIQEVQVENISRLEKLKTIESHALVPPKVEKFSNAQYISSNVYVPAEALEAYKADPVWGQFWNLQAAGVEDIKADSNVKIETGRYDMNGRPVSDDYDGLIIVKYSDGSCKKMINRSK